MRGALRWPYWPFPVICVLVGVLPTAAFSQISVADSAVARVRNAGGPPLNSRNDLGGHKPNLSFNRSESRGGYLSTTMFGLDSLCDARSASEKRRPNTAAQ